MFRTLAILCLVGSAFGFAVEDGPSDRDSHGYPMNPPDFKRPSNPDSHGYPMNPPSFKTPLMPGLKIKHGVKNFAVEELFLFDLALSNISASYQGYIKMNKPRLPAGYCALQLWCRREDNFTVCIYTDETGDVAGVQYNIPCDDFKPKYDMHIQGFSIWTTALNDKIVRYYSYSLFFVSPHSRKRINSKDATVVLRDSEVYYSGFYGKLASVATEMINLDSIFTKQSCVNGLGLLYEYNMTKNLECSPSTLSPFTALFYEDQLVASSITIVGHFIKNSETYNEHYEIINALEIKGDSGGPLQDCDSKSLYHVVGVPSFGKDCGILGSAGMHTRVSHYVPWIESIVWPEETEARRKKDN